MTSLSQAELDEIAADRNTDKSHSDSSSSKSDSEQDEVTKLNEEIISNENAHSGLTVCLDNFGLFCARSLI
jgi:hypothetical protein